MGKQDWLVDIVEHSLKENGYDGLCNPLAECGCFIGDLAPCDSASFTECCGGIRQHSEDGDICVVRIVA